MTNSNLFNYVTKSKNASESLAAFYSLSDRKIIDIEVKENGLDLFRAGYIAAIEEIERNAKIKSDKKTGKFNIYNFLDADILKQCKNGKYGARFFLSGVYHDNDNKKLVTTNGRFLVYCDSENIEECFQNQIVSKDNRIIDGRFPSWLRVIPEKSDLLEVPDIKDKILTCSKYAAIKTQQQGLKCKDTFYIDGLAVSGYMLFMVSKFIKTQKSVKIYRNKESWSKSWEIIGDNATMVFMPLQNIDKIVNGEVENPFTKIYDSSKNILVENNNAT